MLQVQNRIWPSKESRAFVLGPEQSAEHSLRDIFPKHILLVFKGDKTIALLAVLSETSARPCCPIRMPLPPTDSRYNPLARGSVLHVDCWKGACYQSSHRNRLLPAPGPAPPPPLHSRLLYPRTFCPDVYTRDSLAPSFSAPQIPPYP